MINKHKYGKVKFNKSSFKRFVFPIVLIFIMLVIFIFIIQPTDIYNMASEKNKALLIVFLSISFILIFSSELIFLNKRKLNNTKNIIKTHILFSVIIIAASIFILYLRHTFMTKHHFFQYLSVTFAIVTVFQLIIYYFIIKKFFANNEDISSYTESKINISDNKTTLSINFDNLIFIKAEGNYVSVFEKNRKYLIRSTLKKIMEQNKDSKLIRCHKSYIVNPHKIKSISGNTKGYKITVLDYELEIPVSVEIGKELKSAIL